MNIPEIKKDKLLKIITSGDDNVGKTSFLNRYAHDFFLGDYKSTIGLDLLTKDYKTSSEDLKLILWDFGGQEQFREFLSQFSSGAHGGFFVFDMNELKSLRNIKQWLGIMQRDRKNMIPIMIVGAKSDLLENNQIGKVAKIVFNIVQETSMLGTIGYIFTSSKDDINIHRAFKKLIYNINMFQQKKQISTVDRALKAKSQLSF